MSFRKHILLLLGILIWCDTHAQVTYVDIPDTFMYVSTGSTDTSIWDLDNNGTADFKLIVYAQPGNGQGVMEASIVGLGSNEVAGDTAGAFALNAGDTINNQVSWNTAKSTLKFYCYSCGLSYGYWGLVWKYAAIRFYAGSTAYYGWMKMMTMVGTGHSGITFAEYAYTAGTIFTGQGSPNGVAHVSDIAGLTLYPDPVFAQSKVKLPLTSGEAIAHIYRPNGEYVREMTLKAGSELLIDSREFEIGTYFYTLTFQSGPPSHGKFVVIAHP